MKFFEYIQAPESNTVNLILYSPEVRKKNFSIKKKTSKLYQAHSSLINTSNPCSSENSKIFKKHYDWHDAVLSTKILSAVGIIWVVRSQLGKATRSRLAVQAVQCGTTGRCFLAFVSSRLAAAGAACAVAGLYRSLHRPS